MSNLPPLRDDPSSIVDELMRELGEAHRREAATAEVLQADHLGAAFGVIYRFDGELIHIVAHQIFLRRRSQL